VDKIPQVRLNNGLVLPANRIVVQTILNLIVIDEVLAEPDQIEIFVVRGKF
jgi:hypothetical protein